LECLSNLTITPLSSDSACQPLLFQCSFATELLECQSLLISRIQGAAAGGSQQMEARAGLTELASPRCHFRGPPLGKIHITFVQGILHLMFTSGVLHVTL